MFPLKNSPMRGMAMCMKWACSWSCAFASSAWSPSRSFPRTSWGTLHPHPFRSANRVRRKVASRSCATGSNGLRNAKAFGFPPSSSWATDRASCATGVPCRSAILSNSKRAHFALFYKNTATNVISRALFRGINKNFFPVSTQVLTPADPARITSVFK